jgi:hypothetical protein
LHKRDAESGSSLLGGMSILAISQTEAQMLAFPPGHPRRGVLYIGHPAVARIYYTTAQFHRLTFEHKFCEAIRLLMALGAKHIEVEQVSGWGADFSARLNVALGPPDGVGMGAKGRRRHDAHLLFVADLRGSATPVVPSDLFWAEHEPTWQQVIDGRTHYGLRDFSLTVTYEDDFGVNADLKAAAEGASLDLGGAFEDHQATVWRIVGQFLEVAA